MIVVPDHIPFDEQIRRDEPIKLYPSLQVNLTLSPCSGLLRLELIVPYSGCCNGGQSSSGKIMSNGIQYNNYVYK